MEEHQKTVDKVAGSGTIIPFRFGTILKDEQSIQQLLSQRQTDFTNTLQKINGKQEWGVRVYLDNTAFKKSKSKDKLTKPTSGTDYLLQLKQRRDVDSNTDDQVKAITNEVINLANQYAVQTSEGSSERSDVAGKELLLSSSYLISREKGERFKKSITSVGNKYRTMGFDVRLSGPWQPYSFVHYG